jgi:hypothetical protein
MSYQWWHIKLNLQNLKGKGKTEFIQNAVRILNIGCSYGEVTEALKTL